VGWKVTQSKIAIGSGWVLGKGYLEGTQTNCYFDQSSIPILFFCTLGRNLMGWKLSLISLFVGLLYRTCDHVGASKKIEFARFMGTV